MATFRSFEELPIWQQARVFANEVYVQTTRGTFSRDFALRDQINKSTGSIMDNIAEGFERGGTKEFIMFLSYAKGSAGEARSQLHRAYDRNHLDETLYNTLRNESSNISKGVSGFMDYLKTSSIKGPRFQNRQGDRTPEGSKEASI